MRSTLAHPRGNPFRERRCHSIPNERNPCEHWSSRKELGNRLLRGLFGRAVSPTATDARLGAQRETSIGYLAPFERSAGPGPLAFVSQVGDRHAKGHLQSPA